MCVCVCVCVWGGGPCGIVSGLTFPTHPTTSINTTADWVVFVSHRWWNPDEGLPDNEEGEKYDIVCRAVREMIDDGIGE